MELKDNSLLSAQKTLEDVQYRFYDKSGPNTLNLSILSSRT